VEAFGGEESYFICLEQDKQSGMMGKKKKLKLRRWSGFLGRSKMINRRIREDRNAQRRSHVIRWKLFYGKKLTENQPSRKKKSGGGCSMYLELGCASGAIEKTHRRK